MQVDRITIDPAVIYWGERKSQKITCVGPAAGDYFKLHSSTGGKFAIWFEVDSSGAAPSVDGYTAHKVTLAAEPTASATATALAAVIDGLGGLSAEASDDEVVVQDLHIGAAADAEDSTEGTATGFDIETLVEGFGGEVGHTSGDTEFTPTVETKELNSHQGGNTRLAEFITKVDVDRISLVLLEVDKAQLETMFSAIGHSETPDAGTKVVGLGTGSIGRSLISGAKKLVFHPVSKLNSPTDRADDVIFWKAAPVPGTMKWSGTDEKTLTVEFAIYPDPAIKDDLNMFTYGDWTQALQKGA